MSVTDADYRAGDTINSGNALGELEARVARALGVTNGDSPSAETIKRRNAFRRAREAGRTAEICGKCGRDLQPGERVYVACVWAGYAAFGGYTRRYAPVCAGCAPPSMKGEGRYYDPRLDRCEEHPCDACGRPVVWRTTGRDHYRRRVFCCERCRWTYHNGVRNERNARAREKACEVCGEGFTASRRDAKTCSPPCKQKAYRRRKQEAEKGRRAGAP